MYVLIVYDVDGQSREVCKFLRRYLHRVQNSVFKSEITEAKLEKLKLGLKKRLKEESDSVYEVLDENGSTRRSWARSVVPLILLFNESNEHYVVAA